MCEVIADLLVLRTFFIYQYMKQRILMKTKGRICFVKIEPINTSLVSFSAGSNVNLLLPRSLFHDLPPPQKKKIYGPAYQGTIESPQYF